MIKSTENRKVSMFLCHLPFLSAPKQLSPDWGIWGHGKTPYGDFRDGGRWSEGLGDTVWPSLGSTEAGERAATIPWLSSTSPSHPLAGGCTFES